MTISGAVGSTDGVLISILGQVVDESFSEIEANFFEELMALIAAIISCSAVDISLFEKIGEVLGEVGNSGFT
jgi:hypothetical protein